MKNFIILIFLTLNTYADEVLKINRDHSFIKFTIPYMAISEVEGQFRRFEGRLVRTNNGEIKSIEVSVDSSSIDTNLKIRDDHLKESAFLSVEKYPRINIEYLNEDYVLKVKGKTFKSRGKLNELIEKKDTWGKKSYFQKIVKTLPLKDFKFKWNKSLPGGEMLLGDSIEVTAVFQWQDPNQMTAASKHRIPDTKALRKIRFDGDRYQGLEPEMVTVKKKVDLVADTVEAHGQNQVAYVETQRGFSIYIMFILGFIGLIGFYLVSRLSLMNKRKLGTVLDIVFICVICVYLLSSWKYLV